MNKTKIQEVWFESHYFITSKCSGPTCEILGFQPQVKDLYEMAVNPYIFGPIMDCNLRHTATVAAATEAASVAKLLDVHQRRNFSCHRHRRRRT